MRSPRSFFSSVRAQLSQPVFIGEVCQPYDRLSGPPLGPPEKLSIFPLLGPPDLYSVLQMEPHKGE